MISTPAGVMQTRFSSDLISFKIPTIILLLLVLKILETDSHVVKNPYLKV
jgi:hypothetical protein